MILRPCHHCSFRGDCAIKRDILAKVRGLGLSLIGFRCKEKWRDIAVGSRVGFTAKLCWRDEGVEYDERDGTVIGFKADKAVVWLDEPIEDDLDREPRVRVKLHQDRLTLLAEPKRKCCKECGRPDGAENSDNWHCLACELDAAEGPTRTLDMSWAEDPF